MKRDSIDFATMNIPKMFGKLLFPTLLGMLSSATLTIVDGIFVGQGVGSDGLAAVNIVAPLFMITTGIGLMFGIGASIVAAIHLSQNKVKVARINITQSLIVSTAVMLLISTLVMCFRQETGYLFGSSDSLLPLVLEYMSWIAPFLVFNMIMNMGLFIIRLDGSPVYAMLCNVVPALINLVLCYFFVFQFGWGLKGSAMAYSIGIMAGGAMVIVYTLFFSKTLTLYRLKISRNSLALTARNIGYMVKLGSPALLGELAIAVMMLMGNYVFMGTLGEDGVAAFSVACFCFPVVYMVANAVAQSSQPIISFNFGNGNKKRVNKTMFLSINTAIFFGLTATLLTMYFGNPLVALFLNPNCNAYQIAIQGMPYFAMGFIFFSFNIAGVGYYQSIEMAKRSTIYTLLRGFIFMIICFLTLPPLLGVKGIWLSVPCSEILTATVIICFYIRDVHTSRKKTLILQQTRLPQHEWDDK